jgi:hypothetical protein
MFAVIVASVSHEPVSVWPATFVVKSAPPFGALIATAGAMPSCVIVIESLALFDAASVAVTVIVFGLFATSDTESDQVPLPAQLSVTVPMFALIVASVSHEPVIVWPATFVVKSAPPFGALIATAGAMPSCVIVMESLALFDAASVAVTVIVFGLFATSDTESDQVPLPAQSLVIVPIFAVNVAVSVPHEPVRVWPATFVVKLIPLFGEFIATVGATTSFTTVVDATCIFPAVSVCLAAMFTEPLSGTLLTLNVPVVNDPPRQVGPTKSTPLMLTITICPLSVQLPVTVYVDTFEPFMFGADRMDTVGSAVSFTTVGVRTVLFPAASVWSAVTFTVPSDNPLTFRDAVANDPPTQVGESLTDPPMLTFTARPFSEQVPDMEYAIWLVAFIAGIDVKTIVGFVLSKVTLDPLVVEDTSARASPSKSMILDMMNGTSPSGSATAMV